MGPNGDFRLHTSPTTFVDIPSDQRFIPILRRILVARSMTPRPKIGTPSFPTEHMVREWKKEHGEKAWEELVSRLDLTDLEIDL